MRRRVVLASALSPVVLLLPGRADACACCAERGYYRFENDRPARERTDVFDRIRFAAKGQLYTTDGGDDAIKGLTKPADSYAIRGTLAGDAWQMTFRDGARSGTLRLSIPTRMSVHHADLHDGKSGGTGPLIYKEWRWQAPVAGSGFFQAGLARPARYTMVLQGRGNVCDEAENFTHWRLDVEGPGAVYAFYGRLTRPAPVR